MWIWFVKAVWAHLCAHNVRQRLVCDWDVAEKLSDLNTWDGAVERHKESKDWAQSEKDRENTEWKSANMQINHVIVPVHDEEKGKSL